MALVSLFFFFLSGYLITTLLRREWLRTGTISVSHFYIRRAFRILPPLYVAVVFAVTLAWAGITHSHVSWKALVAIQFFLTNYFPLLTKAALPVGLTVLWSLAVEEHFYLLFPWLYRGMLRTNLSRVEQAGCFGGVCLAVLAWRIVLFCGHHVPWERVYTGTDTRLDSILFGAMTAIVANPSLDRFDESRKRTYSIATIVGLLVLLGSIAVRGEVFRQTARYTIQAMALWPVFIYIVLFKRSLATRILEWSVLRRIGELSYSLYLVHYTVMFVVRSVVGTNPYAVTCVTFCVSVIIALGMRYVIELPAYRMRNHVLNRATMTSASMMVNA